MYGLFLEQDLGANPRKFMEINLILLMLHSEILPLTVLLLLHYHHVNDQFWHALFWNDGMSGIKYV